MKTRAYIAMLKLAKEKITELSPKTYGSSKVVGEGLITSSVQKSIAHVIYVFLAEVNAFRDDDMTCVVVRVEHVEE